MRRIYKNWGAKSMFLMEKVNHSNPPIHLISGLFFGRRTGRLVDLIYGI